MAPTAVELRGLSKSLGGLLVVDDVTFAMSEGTVTGLLGPNGAGKTTLVHLLSTLLAPDAGTATVHGHDLLDAPEQVRECIALTGQFTAVDTILTGRQNLLLFGRLLGLGRTHARQRAEELLRRFGLVDAADRAAGGYSGGMGRRLDLACSLVVPRPVLFLDEPTVGLDPRSRQELWEAIEALRSGGTTILLTTQYLEEADRLADEIVVMDHGRVIATGTPSTLKDRVGGTVCAIRCGDARTTVSAARVLADASLVVDGDGADQELVVRDATVATAAEVAGLLATAGIEPEELALRRASLDEVFFAMTSQRDADPPLAGHGAGTAR